MKQILAVFIIVAMVSFTACISTNRLSNVSTNEAKGIISGWDAKTQEVANTMMAKYGAISGESFGI